VDVGRSCGLVSVIIPTFNRREWLAETVKPVLDDPHTGEVVVVVDGCRDGSLELLQEWSRQQPRLRAIFQENAGDAAARQRGVEEARFDIVVVLDDDIVPSPGLIGGHARHHAQGGRHLVLGYMPVQLPEPRQPGQAAAMLYSRAYEKQCRRYAEDPDSILNTFWMGNISLSRSSALEVGFSTKLSIRRHSDMVFGIRCREAGLDAIFDRSLLALHSHNRSLKKFAADSRNSGEARAKLMKEYPEFEPYINPFAQLPWFERMAIYVLGSSVMCPACTQLAMAGSFRAGRMRVWGVETLSARILQQIEIYHGFREAQRSL
jgi:glycosyltransferase involved in cell wall biosynthesis